MRRLSVSEIRFGRNDGAIRQGSAAQNATYRLDRPRQRCVFGQRKMCPGAVVILLVRTQHMPQMPLAKHDHMIEALASDRADRECCRYRKSHPLGLRPQIGHEIGPCGTCST